MTWDAPVDDSAQPIPKRIHYCWFGYGDKPDEFENIIASWRKHLPDYEIIEWNERNFDVDLLRFTSEAYRLRKWAFLTDFVRSWALLNFGGVYLDTDVEIKATLTPFLAHEAFSGFERPGYPFTALWGARPGHKWPRLICEYYENIDGFEQITNTKIVSQVLVDEFGVDPLRDELQYCLDGVVIYPSTHFCLDLPKNIASHHFAGSWPGAASAYKDEVHQEYYYRQFRRLVESRVGSPQAPSSAFDDALYPELGSVPTRVLSLHLAARLVSSTRRMVALRVLRTLNRESNRANN